MVYLCLVIEGPLLLLDGKLHEGKDDICLLHS